MRLAVKIIAWVYLAAGIAAGFRVVYAILFGGPRDDLGGVVLVLLLGYGLLHFHPLARGIVLLLSVFGLIGGVIGIAPSRAAFAADGQVLASASIDETIKLWDVRTGQELRTLRGHTANVTSVAFAADGQVLASASMDNTVKLWDVRRDQDPEKERRFRLLVTAPDLHLHRELAEQADKDKQPFAVAFRLGRYLAAKNYYAANPKDEVKPPFSAQFAPLRLSSPRLTLRTRN